MRGVCPACICPGLIIISTSCDAEWRSVDSLDTCQMPVHANQLSKQGKYLEQLCWVWAKNILLSRYIQFKGNLGFGMNRERKSMKVRC